MKCPSYKFNEKWDEFPASKKIYFSDPINVIKKQYVFFPENIALTTQFGKYLIETRHLETLSLRKINDNQTENWI